MGFIERFRRWVDGDNIDSGSTWGINPPAERRADIFAAELAQQVARVMEQEMFSPPGGPAYVPHRYIIYLSKRADRLWPIHKRKILLTWLIGQITRRASELTARQLPARAIHIDVRLDGTLEHDQFRVQHLWSSPVAASVTTGKKATAQDEPQKLRAFGGG